MLTRVAQGWQSPRSLACDEIALPALADDAALDAATLAYVAAARAPFDALRQAAGQIAGVLVLAVSSKKGAAGHPMLDLADAARTEAIDSIRRLHPPPRAAHHHRHLAQAAQLIGLALDAARLHRTGDDDARTDAVMRPLRAGFRELQWAAGALPGFEVVAFSQGCCARHLARSSGQPATNA